MPESDARLPDQLDPFLQNKIRDERLFRLVNLASNPAAPEEDQLKAQKLLDSMQLVPKYDQAKDGDIIQIQPGKSAETSVSGAAINREERAEQLNKLAQ